MYFATAKCLHSSLFSSWNENPQNPYGGLQSCTSHLKRQSNEPMTSAEGHKLDCYVANFVSYKSKKDLKGLGLDVVKRFTSVNYKCS